VSRRRVGRRREAAAFAFALAFVVACAGGTDPQRLEPGDCFDVPSGDRIGGVTARACDEPHRGEVFHRFDAAPAAAAYPTDPEWEEIVYPACDPVFASYTGTPVGDRTDIEYRYLVPTADAWANGDRRVACFITSPDGSPLQRSYRGT
jgi:hypothetical protein